MALKSSTSRYKLGILREEDVQYDGYQGSRHDA
jgi:hypothetical protein